MPERNRYIRGLRSWVGWKQTSILYERDPRFAGEVKYTFRKSLSLAGNGLISFSRVPLRLSTYVGLVAAAVAVLMAVLVLYWRIDAPNSPLTGFATIMIAIFFLGAVQLVSIGILGEYVGRIYEEVKGRPLYVLSEVGGFTEPSSVYKGDRISSPNPPTLGGIKSNSPQNGGGHGIPSGDGGNGGGFLGK
jgi:dolichol-phosphate mannosyltransferase